MKLVRIATRKSRLAVWQAEFVRSLLARQFPQSQFEIITFSTTGDQRQDVALSQIGGKTNFVTRLQQAILSNEADIAVHSVKDMSAADTDALTLAAICEREDPRDAFISKKYASIERLPAEAVVGTASPRRACLLKSIQPDIQIRLLRGNVQTRLAKLSAGEFDAIILATAGIKRLRLSEHITQHLPVDVFTPAIGQGAIGVECRSDDGAMIEMVAAVNHETSRLCVSAERAMNRILKGGCHSAIGAYAFLEAGCLHLSAMVGSVTDGHLIRAHDAMPAHQALLLGERVAQKLLNQNAAALLR